MNACVLTPLRAPLPASFRLFQRLSGQIASFDGGNSPPITLHKSHVWARAWPLRTRASIGDDYGCVSVIVTGLEAPLINGWLGQRQILTRHFLLLRFTTIFRRRSLGKKKNSRLPMLTMTMSLLSLFAVFLVEFSAVCMVVVSGRVVRGWLVDWRCELAVSLSASRRLRGSGAWMITMATTTTTMLWLFR